jgi:hypothetical protein
MFPEFHQLGHTNLFFVLYAEFDLETLRGKLDENGLAIAEKQEASVNSRKQLAERTKGQDLHEAQ